MAKLLLLFVICVGLLPVAGKDVNVTMETN